MGFCNECGHDEDAAITERKELENRIETLERALDDVMSEINNARADLNDAEKIVRKHI